MPGMRLPCDVQEANKTNGSIRSSVKSMTSQTAHVSLAGVLLGYLPRSFKRLGLVSGPIATVLLECHDSSDVNQDQDMC